MRNYCMIHVEKIREGRRNSYYIQTRTKQMFLFFFISLDHFGNVWCVCFYPKKNIYNKKNNIEIEESFFTFYSFVVFAFSFIIRAYDFSGRSWSDCFVCTVDEFDVFFFKSSVTIQRLKMCVQNSLFLSVYILYIRIWNTTSYVHTKKNLKYDKKSSLHSSSFSYWCNVCAFYGLL